MRELKLASIDVMWVNLEVWFFQVEIDLIILSVVSIVLLSFTNFSCIADVKNRFPTKCDCPFGYLDILECIICFCCNA